MYEKINFGIVNFLWLDMAQSGTQSCLGMYSKTEVELITEINLALRQNPGSNKALVISKVLQDYMEKLTIQFHKLNSTLSAVGTNNQVQMSINTSSNTLDSFYTLVKQITEAYKKKDQRYEQLLKEFHSCKNNLSVCKSSLTISGEELKQSYIEVEVLLGLLDKAQVQFTIAQDFFSGPVRVNPKSDHRFGIEAISDSEVYALVRNSIEQKLLTLQTFSEVIKQSYGVLKKQEQQIVTLLGFSIPDAEMQALTLQAQQNIPFPEQDLVSKSKVKIRSNSKYEGVSEEFIERITKSKQTILGERVIQRIENNEVNVNNLFESLETERRRYLLELESDGNHSAVLSMEKVNFYTLKDLEMIFTVLIDKVASKKDYGSLPYRLRFKNIEIKKIQFGNIDISALGFFSGLFLLSKDINDKLYKDFIVLYNSLLENKITELKSKITVTTEPSWFEARWLSLSEKGRAKQADTRQIQEKNWNLNYQIRLLKSLRMEPSSDFVALLLEVLETNERSVSLFDTNGNKLGELPLSVKYGSTDESN